MLNRCSRHCFAGFARLPLGETCQGQGEMLDMVQGQLRTLPYLIEVIVEATADQIAGQPAGSHQ